MDPRVRRRVVSAPILKTSRGLQTEGPPAAFDPPSKDEESLIPRNFDFCIHNPSRLANDDRPVDERTYRRLLQYLHQIQVLLVLIWADMTILFHPTSISYCILFQHRKLQRRLAQFLSFSLWRMVCPKNTKMYVVVPFYQRFWLVSSSHHRDNRMLVLCLEMASGGTW